MKFKARANRGEAAEREAAAKRRYNRLAQAKHRGSAQSYVTKYENAVIVLAWEAGALSEGQAAKALGVHRLLARVYRESLIADGLKVGGELWKEARATKRRDYQPQEATDAPRR